MVAPRRAGVKPRLADGRTGHDRFPWCWWQVRGGFWTPGTIVDDRLLERRRSHSGVAFEVLD